jgi:nicotinate-nucleotide pyrophosphorylase (carboxylating)
MRREEPPHPFGRQEQDAASVLAELALAEDLGQSGDLTSQAIIPASALGAGRVVSREHGVVAGLPILRLLCEVIDPRLHCEPAISDGDPVAPGTLVARISGSLRSLLSIERTALNFLQRLSGIASLTARFVAEVRGTRAIILDTRKTTPGFRVLEKYAVQCGGGRNHRMGLFDAVLIKDNHLAALSGSTDPIGTAVRLAREQAPEGTTIEIEVDRLDQLDRALACEPDIILLDNFALDSMSEAVRRRDSRAPGVLLEVSGGVRLETVAAMAATGVDRISVGALTHSARALDLGLDF